MLSSFFPVQAGPHAARVDELTLVLLLLSLFFALGIAACIVFFSIRYHKKRTVNRERNEEFDGYIEVAWIGIPLLLSLVVFGWAASLYMQAQEPPEGALTINVVGKQWMWKVQHPAGRREIDELHVPRGQPIKLLMTSQDVIHSFFLPALRLKQDVLPRRYTTLWFTADKTGEYPLYCAEYCGTMHSRMKGRLVVLEPAAYARWLAEGGAPAESVAARGKELFTASGCAGCHLQGTCPPLEGVFGRKVPLADGTFAEATEAYFYESILQPQAKIVAGYPPIMPSFQGQLGDSEVFALVTYLKSLGGPEQKP